MAAAPKPSLLSRIRHRLARKFVGGPAGLGHPVGTEALDREYRTGAWDHFFSADELPRNLVVAGLVHHHFARPSVLDVGCGSGRLAQLFQAYPFSRYLGADVSAEGLARARALGLPGVEWAQGNYETWRPPGRFDAIVFNECIGYARDPGAVLAAFAGHLEPGGLFFLSHYRFGHHRAQWRRMEAVCEPVFATAVVSARGQTWDIKVLRPRASTA